MTRMQPRSSAQETLSIDCSIKAAGRKMPASMSLRQARLELLKRLLDAAGDFKRVAPRKLLDDEQQPRMAVDDGIADQRLMVLLDIGDVTQRQ